MQSLSLRSEVTPPTTPTKIGSFTFMSPTKVRSLTSSFVANSEIVGYSFFRKFLPRLFNAAFRQTLMTIFLNLTLIIWIIEILLMTLPILIVKVSQFSIYNCSTFIFVYLLM